MSEIVTVTMNPAVDIHTAAEAVKARPYLLKPNRREIKTLVDCEFGDTKEFKQSVGAFAQDNSIQAIVVSAGVDCTPWCCRGCVRRHDRRNGFVHGGINLGCRKGYRQSRDSGITVSSRRTNNVPFEQHLRCPSIASFSAGFPC